MSNRIASVICEYNPFHNGHEYMLQQMRFAGITHIAAIMSGNFTQRGEAALLHKKLRAEAAINCGADLVIELPLTFSCAGAERFSLGGVCLTDALGCIDELWFGSESGNTDILVKVAQVLSSDKITPILKKFLSEGITFASARQKAVSEFIGDEYASVLSSPNDILGVGYIASLLEIGSSVIPHALKRSGAAHDSIFGSGNIQSASAIRSLISSGYDYSDFVPDKSFNIINQNNKYLSGSNAEQIFQSAVMCRLKMMTAEDFLRLPDVSEGLENRFVRAASEAMTLDELCSMVKTKRYTLSRIRRIILYSLLGLEKDKLSRIPLYIHVLAANERGHEILHLARRNSSLPLINGSSGFRKLNEEAKKMSALEQRADKLYDYLLS